MARDLILKGGAILAEGTVIDHCRRDAARGGFGQSARICIV